MPLHLKRSAKSDTSGKSTDPGSENDEGSMSLSGHLKELRNRIIVCVIAMIATFLIGLNYSPRLVDLLTDLGTVHGYEFVALEPAELLMQYFGVAFLIAVILTLPLLIFQIWAFIRPGLKKNENKIFLLVITFGLFCFILGILFAYRIMLPFMLRFLINVGKDSVVTSSISIARYLTFLFTIFIIFGVVFEMPVVTVALTQLGLLRVSWLKKARKVVIIIIFLISAFITPPDVVSQIMVSVPMILLYQLSIMISTFIDRRKTSENNSETDHKNVD